MTRGIDFRFVYLAVASLYARMRDTAGARATLKDPFAEDRAPAKTPVGFAP